MSASVTKEVGPRPFVAWCDRCQDGERHHTTKRAQSWADGHNTRNHLDIPTLERITDAGAGREGPPTLGQARP